MSVTFTQVATYRLEVGGDEHGPRFIDLRSHANKMLVRFSFTTPSNKPLPAASRVEDWVLVYARRDTWLILVDLLRNERPLWVARDLESRPPFVSLGTQEPEPIGEAELPVE